MFEGSTISNERLLEYANEYGEKLATKTKRTFFSLEKVKDIQRVQEEIISAENRLERLTSAP